jgi:signal transduction histidine kinase
MTESLSDAAGVLPRILLILDDADLRERALSALTGDYRASVAEGAGALTTARAARPDLILCDPHLGDPTGGGPVWRALRGDAELGGLPLILIAARDGMAIEAADADDILYHPFSGAELLARLRIALTAARQRREAEAVLRRVDIVLRHLPFGLTMVNGEGRIVYANPARERLLHVEGQPNGGDTLAPRLPARRADGTPLESEDYPIRRALRGELTQETELLYDNGDGPPRWLRASGIPVPGPDGNVQYAIGIAIDISSEMQARAELLRLTQSLEERVRAEIDERLKAEETLRQVQKMQAIGQLTGGVAHDFNNMLQVMLGHFEALERQVKSLAPLERARIAHHVDAALRGAERAVQMTRQLLAFSRRQPLSPTVTDINALVLRMSDLFRRTLGENIAIKTTPMPDLQHAYVDQNHLENALLNLAVNARDAMPDGGRLTIETANCAFGGALSEPWEEFVAGDYVMIAVSDTGTGIAREVMPRLFEPFFTTKEVGRGTGLGLAQAYGFAKQSGGHIKIYSELGLGTTVRIYLPAREASDRATVAAAPPPAQRAEPGECVLVVEDDPDVRAFSSETLRDLGYSVVEAASGAEALRCLGEEPRIRLMFTDVGLPEGMNGRQLAEHALRRRPDLKVLFTTGYARDAVFHGSRLEPGVELIPKPFTAGALAARIRNILENA